MAAPEIGARVSVMSESENLVIGGLVIGISGTDFEVLPDVDEHAHAVGVNPRRRNVVANEAGVLTSRED